MPPKLLDDTALAFKQDNPKRAGTKAHERYEQYKVATNVRDALALGAVKADIANDIKMGHCSLQGCGEGVDGMHAQLAPPGVAGALARKRAAGDPGAGAPVASPQAAKRPAVEVAAQPPAALAAPPAAVAAPPPAEIARPEVEASIGRTATLLPEPPATSSSSSAATAPASAAGRHSDVDLSFAKFEGMPVKFMRRSMGEAKRLLSPEGIEDGRKSGYTFTLKDRDNLSKWGVRLSDLNPDGQLSKGLAKLKLDLSIDLEISLPSGFPLEPPFVRVVYPQLTGGYVFSRGGICFEPLTAKGWAPSMTLPALVIAIKGILDYGDVRVAGAGNRETRTVPTYTEDGARKDHSQIVTAHRGGESSSYGSLKNYAS